MQNITARRSANFYNITNSKGKVARFCLFKSAYKLGEDVIGTFDFEMSTLSCVQVLNKKIDLMSASARLSE